MSTSDRPLIGTMILEIQPRDQAQELQEANQMNRIICVAATVEYPLKDYGRPVNDMNGASRPWTRSLAGIALVFGVATMAAGASVLAGRDTGYAV